MLKKSEEEKGKIRHKPTKQADEAKPKNPTNVEPTIEAP